MASFQFPFQRILEMKEKEKEEYQLQMAKAIQRQERVEHRLNETSLKLLETEKEISDQQIHGVTISELRMLERYKGQLKTRLSLEKQEYMYAQNNVNQKQELLHTRLQEEKVWMTLRDNHRHNFLQQQKKDEQIQLDEIANSRFHRLVGGASNGRT